MKKVCGECGSTSAFRDSRMKSLGYLGSMIGKLLILERERVPGRNLAMILVNERPVF